MNVLEGFNWLGATERGAQNEAPEVPVEGHTQEQELPPFERFWESALEELGFRRDEFGNMVFGETAEESEADEATTQTRFDPSLYRAVVAGMVDEVLKSYGEDIASDKLLREAAIAFLSSQPPQALSDAGVRLVILAGLGLRFLQERKYNQLAQVKQIKENPKSTLNPNFRAAAENLAQQMGLDPDELMAEYIEEWYKKHGGVR